MSTKNSYNLIADQWAAVRNNSFVSDLIIDFAMCVQPNGNILDVGCGTGLPVDKYFSDQNFKVTGIDESEQMIKLAQSNSIKNVDFFVADFFDFTSKDQFDGIIAWDSLWHFQKEKQLDIYPKIYDLLKPGGFFLFTHGKTEGEHQDKMFEQPFYYSSMARETVTGLLRKMGFKIEYAYEDFREKDTHRELVVLAMKK